METAARPDRAAWRTFTTRLMLGAGIAAASAGVIFFVAANWQALGVIGRFALLQAAFVACAGIALKWTPPRVAGSAACAALVLVTGALLALFGQSYQTGADLYELFFTWALLALPFALGGRSGAVWAIWWIVLDIALALFFGGRFRGWTWIDRVASESVRDLTPFVINLAGAAIFLALRRTAYAEHAPRWLARLLLAIAFFYGTVISIKAILGEAWTVGAKDSPGIVLVFALASAAVATYALTVKRDVFPMAVVLAGAIAVSTALIGNAMSHADIGTFFLVSLWIIGTSTASGVLLMKWFRAWRTEDEEEGPAASRPERSPGARPWYISLLVGAAGWFAGFFVLAFVALLFHLQGAGSGVVIGLVLVAGAAGLYFADREGQFVTQLALALSVAGQCFLLFGLSELFTVSGTYLAGISFIALILQAALAWIMPNALHRTMSTFFACIAWGLFMRDTPVGHLSAVGWMITWVPVAGLLYMLVKSGAEGVISGPVSTGLIIGLAVATLAFDPADSWSRWNDAQGGSIAMWPLLSAFAALGALCAAFALGKRGLTAACIVAALAHVSLFYYVMGATLLMKSLTMIALGALLLAGAYLSRSRVSP